MKFNEHIHTWFEKTTISDQRDWINHHKEYPDYLEVRS